MIKKIKNKISLPILFGIILASLDFVFWLWFLIYWFINRHELFLGEGLFGMMIIHAPASFLLPLLGSLLISVFSFIFPIGSYLLPQTIFLFVVGITQYYLVGYFIGWIVLKIRCRLGFEKASKKKQKNQKKNLFYNILYLIFTVLFFKMLMDILSRCLLDFEMYKKNYPPSRHIMEGLVALAWGFFTYRIFYNKKYKKAVLIGLFCIILIFIAVYTPKLSISDIPEATALESFYASEQAKIFFDNPLERLIIMKTAIIGMDDDKYYVTAYTFFGLKYRTTTIERVSKADMGASLNPGLAQRQAEEQARIKNILNKIQHPSWQKFTYDELIKKEKFSPEKINAIIPGIGSGNSVFLKTDYDEHEVYLIVYLESVYTNVLKKNSFVFEDQGFDTRVIVDTKDIKISPAHCDSVLDSYRIEINNRPYFMILDVLSDQEPPANLNHIWDPDHNIEKTDIMQVLKNLAGVGDKEYADDNISFSYPSNFYVEKDDKDIIITPFSPDNINRNNPEGFSYTFLKIKRVEKGSEYDDLMKYFKEKSQDESYQEYLQENSKINNISATIIKYIHPFSGGMMINVILDMDDYFLHVSYFGDTLYVDEYEGIVNSIKERKL